MLLIGMASEIANEVIYLNKDSVAGKVFTFSVSG